MKTLERMTRDQWEQADEWKPRGRRQPFTERGGARRDLSAFFEHLTARVLGGKVLYNHKDDKDLRPDVHDEESGTWRETKISYMGRHLEFVENQHDNYATLARKEPIEYMLFRHRIPAIQHADHTRESLHDLGATTPKIALVAPFLVIHAAVQFGLPYSRPYVWGVPMHTLASSLVNGLIAQPAEWLANIGLDPQSFYWAHYRTPPITNLGRCVKPFVFTYIREKK